jgi:hypothetical protein
MRIAQYCIAVAATAALCGMSLGIWMGMHEDFVLMPVHAHLNLLGWVSMALYGLYYRGAEAFRPRLAWTQAIAGTIGFIVLTGGLAALLLTRDPRYIPVLTIGELLVVAGMVLFLLQVLTEGRHGAEAAPAATGRS